MCMDRLQTHTTTTTNTTKQIRTIFTHQRRMRFLFAHRNVPSFCYLRLAIRCLLPLPKCPGISNYNTTSARMGLDWLTRGESVVWERERERGRQRERATQQIDSVDVWLVLFVRVLLCCSLCDCAFRSPWPFSMLNGCAWMHSHTHHQLARHHPVAHMMCLWCLHKWSGPLSFHYYLSKRALLACEEAD